MLSLLLEGVESAVLPCSLTLLVPGAAVALAARQESTSALGGFAVGAAGLSFLRFSARGGDLPNGVVALLFAVAVVMLAVPIVRRLNLVSGAGGFLGGLAAGALWVPCVGAEFGQLLGELPDRGGPGLALFLTYLVGVLTPLVALGATLFLVPNKALMFLRPLMLLIGGGALAIFALAAAVGLTDSIIGRLVEWSVT